MGKPARELTIPKLLNDSKKSDRSTRLRAAAAWRQLCPKARLAVPGLVETLRTDADAHVRKMAALALGEIGPDANAAVPTLIEAMQDKDEGVRRRAAVALRVIDASACTEAARTIERKGDRFIENGVPRHLLDGNGVAAVRDHTWPFLAAQLGQTLTSWTISWPSPPGSSRYSLLGFLSSALLHTTRLALDRCG
jgi:HEAT repeat protein